MRTAERVVITLGCSVVRKSSALQALRSQIGACATVVVTVNRDRGSGHMDRVWVWVWWLRGLRTFALGNCRDRELGRWDNSGSRGGRGRGCGGWV